MSWSTGPRVRPSPARDRKLITPEQLAGVTESSHQKALFCWAALNVGNYPALAYMFAVPNGGLRDMRTAVNLKAEGLRSGVPDIFLPCPVRQGWDKINPDGSYHGCFIEMKLEKYQNHKNGGCSDEQIDFIEFAASMGYYCKVCYSWIEAKDVLIAYLEGKV